MATLAHTVVSAEGASPSRAMLFMHGILGTRSNWRSFARGFVEARPDWAAVLVDLRHHGDSLGFEPPDDLDACVGDLLELTETLDLPVRGALGHSFGGKVALALLSSGRLELDEVIVVDVDPASARERGRRGVEAVVSELRALPREFDDRDAYERALAEAGFGRTMQGWLSMNLVRTERGVRFGPDLEAIDALLTSHLETDRMDVATRPPANTRLRFLVAERSDAVSADSRARLEAAAARGAVELTVAEGAGHWVQVDAPDLVREFLAQRE